MSFFFAAFSAALRTRLSSRRTWAALLLLPLIPLASARLLPAEELSAPVQVGVVLPAEGGGDFWSLLEARSGLAVVFLPADYSQAEGQVAAGRWDCALVLPEDFSRRLARGDSQELFTLLVGPGSTVYPLVRETAAACAAQCLAPGIAEDCLLEREIVSASGIEAVRPRLNQVLLEQDRVRLSMETADGAPLDPLSLGGRGMSALLSGLTAILLLIWVLLTAMDLGRWLASPFARRLAPLRGALPLLLPRLAAALLPALCAGGLSLLAAGCSPACLLALIPYLLFWGAAALALARCPPAWNALPALVPFAPVLGLLLSPALLDLSQLFPALAPAVRWNPVTLFLRACGGSWADGLALLAGGAAILALLAASDRKKA